MVDMVAVRSSNIESIGYDTEAQELHVRFLRMPGVYVYPGVPESLYQDLLSARSKGKFFHRYIRRVYTNFEVR